MMGKPQIFINDLKAYDGRVIDDWIVKDLQPILKDPGFNETDVAKASKAASSMCVWVINIARFNEIYKKVKPLMDAADEAELLSNDKAAELAIVREKVRVIVERVQGL